MSKLVSFSEHRTRVWFAWITLSLFLAYQYVLRVLPNVIMPYLEETFKITAGDFGQFSGLYYIGYTAMHIPLGIMLDFIGPRLVVSTSIFLLVLGMLPLAYSESWALTNIGRLIVGISSSAAILGIFKVLRMGFPSHKFPLMLGISVTIGFFGASYGGHFAGYASNIIGVKPVLEYLIYIGLALVPLSFIALPGDRIKSDGNTMSELKELFSHKKWIYIAAIGGLMVGPLEGFADGWATTFLKVAYSNLNEHLFSSLPSLIFLGLAIGAPILGYIAEKTEAYYTLIILCAIGMLVGFILLFFQLDAIFLLTAVFFAIGAFSAYQTIVIHKSCSLAPEKFAGLSTACANMIIMIFGYFFHTVIAEVIELNTKVDSYTFSGLVSGIAVVPACLLIASILFTYIAVKDKER